MSKWETVRLGDICTYSTGGTPDTSVIDYYGGVFPWITTTALSSTHVEPSGVKSYVTEKAIRCTSTKLVPAESILIGIRVGVGKVSISQFELCTNQDVLAIKDFQCTFLPEYLRLALIGKQTFLKGISRGATIQGIKTGDVLSLVLPCPPLPIQQKIADTLDQATTLIEKRKTQIEKLDQLIKSRFIEMFGDPAVNPNEWEVKSLTAFYDSQDAVKCGPFGSALKKDEYVEQGVPVWAMDNITKNGTFIPKPFLYITPQKYSQLQSYSVKANDVIISRAGTVGKMCVVDDSFGRSIISTNLIRVRFNDLLLPLYFVMLLSVWGSRVCKLRTGNDGAFTHMNTSALNSISFPYPHLTLQSEFVDFIQKVDKSKFELQQGLEKLEINHKTLMHECFQ